MEKLERMPTLTNHKGFTLIEVLIALAILAIALTAVIEATSKNIQNTLYLQNKTIASWVGLEIINEAKINFLTPVSYTHLTLPTKRIV